MPRRTKRQYTRHGLTAPKMVIRARGLRGIDKRTAGARDVLAWRKRMLMDLGGESNLSAGQLELLENACRTRLLLQLHDAYLFGQRQPVRHQGVIRERQKLLDSLERTLNTLGLNKQRPRRTLADLQDEVPEQPAPPVTR